MALIGQVVSDSEKMFENNGHIHVYSPGAGADNPLGSNSFHKHTIKYPVNLVISCKFFQINDFLTVCPIQTHKRPNLTLP